MRNPEDGYTGGVRLVTALVPLLKGTLLKEGTADELAASSTLDDLTTAGVVGLGSSLTGDEFGTFSPADDFAASSIADDFGAASTGDDFGTSSTGDDLGTFSTAADVAASSADEAFAGGGFAVYVVFVSASNSRFKENRKSYDGDCHWSLGDRHGDWRRA